MAVEYFRKSGQIPAFGDWDNANELPITQYFECARQAGLLRCSCSGDCGNTAASWGGAADLYGVAFQKPPPRRAYTHPQRKTSAHSKEQRKQVKVGDLMDQPKIRHIQKQTTTKSGNLVPQKPVKPVDEDLYKIPPELLENSKRKKMLGFFSKCMVPPCAA